jgi:hypothetical protein
MSVDMSNRNLRLREISAARALIKLNKLKYDSGLYAIFSLIHDFDSEGLLFAIGNMISQDPEIHWMDKEILLEELAKFPITIEELRLIAQQPLNRFLSFDILKR